MTDYKELNAQLETLVTGVPHRIANLGNASALLFYTLEDLNWAGFYLMEEGRLVLGPFQGKPACIRIPCGRGVCGTALAEDRIVRVPDVHTFPGHIACDSASNSEIVVPLCKEDAVWGVLDIDSPCLNRFSAEDAACMEKLAGILEKNLFGKR